MKFKFLFSILGIFFISIQSYAQTGLEQKIKAIEGDVIEWRRHFHQNPELSNREFKTADYIANFLTELGLEVETGIAHTGVVGLLKGGQPGPTIGLRADIDGLPVTERNDLPFKSTVETTFMGKETGVMHACGHDTHIAMLMGAAKVLTDMKKEIKGNVVFVFQPAEEGAPDGEEGGAELMVKEGLIDKYGIEVFFGQHIAAGNDVGTIKYRKEGIMAAVNAFDLVIEGKQTHGSRPWQGVDPITVAAQTILGFQNIISRQTELTKQAAVISIGKVDSGVRSNIIPEKATLIGTIRTLDTEMKEKLLADMERMATNIAESYGATAKLNIHKGYPVTYNDPELTEKMLPTLAKAGKVELMDATTGAEDFSFFAQEVPSLYYFVGGKPLNVAEEDSAAHHTPDFFIDESGMITGVKSLIYLTLDYMNQSTQ